MRKKISTILVALLLVISSTGVIYGSDGVKNDKVAWLKVKGIDLNSEYETGEVKGVSYEAGTNTLTLNNCNISLDEDSFIYYVGDIPLNIKIKGNNTITGIESEDETYAFNFLECESDHDGKDSSVNISGGGTLNLNKIRNIADNHILKESKESTTSINDVRINAEGGGFMSFVGNLKIENSTIKIDNSSAKGESAINIGSMLNEYGGKINIKKSLVEIKVGKYSEYYYNKVLEGRFFSTNGLNIYAGETAPKWKANEKSILGRTEDTDEAVPNYPTKSTEDYIGYVLITEENLNLPDILIAHDKHTSYTIKNRKTATYFEIGYTGDKVCKICGKIISTGKTTAKKSISTPNVKKGKKKITVKYKKIAGATGFEVRYKKAGGKWSVKKYKGNKNCNKVIKKLKSATKYTVQLRVVSGKKYSNWSKSKIVKVK